MRISKAIEAIKELYKTNSVVALISERGVGKTSAFKQSANELGIGYIDLYASALEGPDFMGLPSKDINKGLTTYLEPNFLPTEKSIKSGLYPENGLLIFEEINRISTETTAVLYPLLLEREINGHKLGKGWKIGVTMNPDSMNYIVNTLDDAMLDRFISIKLEPNIKDYINYSKKNNYNQDVLDYLNTFPDMLLSENSNFSPLDKSPTPRAWTKVQEILNSCNLDETLLQEVLSGIIGPIASSSFIGFTKRSLDLLPSVDLLFSDYKQVSEDIKKIISKNKVEVLSNLITSVVSKINTNKSSIIQLNKFLNDLPLDLQILFYKELSSAKPEVLTEIAEHLDSFNNASDTIIDLLVG